MYILLLLSLIFKVSGKDHMDQSKYNSEIKSRFFMQEISDIHFTSS